MSKDTDCACSNYWTSQWRQRLWLSTTLFPNFVLLLLPIWTWLPDGQEDSGVLYSRFRHLLLFSQMLALGASHFQPRNQYSQTHSHRGAHALVLTAISYFGFLVSWPRAPAIILSLSCWSWVNSCYINIAAFYLLLVMSSITLLRWSWSDSPKVFCNLGRILCIFFAEVSFVFYRSHFQKFSYAFYFSDNLPNLMCFYLSFTIWIGPVLCNLSQF